MEKELLCGDLKRKNQPLIDYATKLALIDYTDVSRLLKNLKNPLRELPPSEEGIGIARPSLDNNQGRHRAAYELKVESCASVQVPRNDACSQRSIS